MKLDIEEADNKLEVLGKLIALEIKF